MAQQIKLILLTAVLYWHGTIYFSEFYSMKCCILCEFSFSGFFIVEGLIYTLNVFPKTM